MAFVTIHVGEMERSLRFYGELLGLTVARRFSPRPGSEIVFLRDGAGHQLELIKEPEGPGADEGQAGVVERARLVGPSLGFPVDDLEGTLARLKAAGVPLLRGPIPIGQGRQIAFVSDPDGVEIEFITGFAHQG